MRLLTRQINITLCMWYPSGPQTYVISNIQGTLKYTFDIRVTHCTSTSIIGTNRIILQYHNNYYPLSQKAISLLLVSTDS